MADDKKDPKAAFKAALLDLLKTDDDTKLAITEAVAAVQGGPLSIDNIKALVDAHLADLAKAESSIKAKVEAWCDERLKSAPSGGLTKDDVTALVLDLFRMYMRPDAINGTYATRLFQR